MQYRQTHKITLGRQTIITDPCFDANDKNKSDQGIIRTLPGEWICDCSYDPTEENIRALRIKHSTFGDKEYTCDKLHLENFSTIVESGLAGFFDMEYFQWVKNNEIRSDEWYERVCKSAHKHVDNNRMKLSDNIDIMHIVNRLATNFIDRKISRENYSDIVCTTITSQHMNSSYISSEIIRILEEKGCELSKDAESIDSDVVKKYVTDICSICHNITEKDFYALNHTREINDAVAIDNKGYVSTTAYGDGAYACYTHKDKHGNVVYIKLIYDLTDEEFIKEFGNDITKRISEYDDRKIEDFLDVDLSKGRKRPVIKQAIKTKSMDSIIEFCSQNEDLEPLPTP